MNNIYETSYISGAYYKESEKIMKEKTNLKEDTNVEERLNKFLEENNIIVDKNGNFEMYVVVDADDKDHEIGSIICGKDTEVYTKDRAYEDLKEDNNKGNLFSFNMDMHLFSNKVYSENNIEKQATIREELLKLEDKMFKILVNKGNVLKVSYIDSGVIYVNKYRVIEEIELTPTLKFKIKSIDSYNGIALIKLYNSITQKSKTISLRDVYASTLDMIKMMVNDYLDRNEEEVDLINSIIEGGVEL